VNESSADFLEVNLTVYQSPFNPAISFPVNLEKMVKNLYRTTKKLEGFTEFTVLEASSLRLDDLICWAHNEGSLGWIKTWHRNRKGTSCMQKGHRHGVALH
jgi:hypothetical protein